MIMMSIKNRKPLHKSTPINSPSRFRFLTSQNLSSHASTVEEQRSDFKGWRLRLQGLKTQFFIGQDTPPIKGIRNIECEIVLDIGRWSLLNAMNQYLVTFRRIRGTDTIDAWQIYYSRRFAHSPSWNSIVVEDRQRLKENHEP